MTNQLSVVIGVIAGVVTVVVTRVGVELCLWPGKLGAISISTPCSGALAAPASPLPPMGRFGGILIH